MAKAAYLFLGMNPYLEHRVLWEGCHARLIPIIANQLQPQLDPRYVAAVEERVYVEGPQERLPDVWIERTREDLPLEGTSSGRSADTALIVEIDFLEIHQKRIEILDSRKDLRLVAVIELVSPSNKRSGAGRQAYLKKERELLASECHLIEIDLLRRGAHVLSVPEWRVEEEGAYDYLVCVNRWPNRHRFELYPRRLRERLPQVKIPLVEPDPDVTLDLQAAVEQVYQEGRYWQRLRYDEPCIPPLANEDQKWAWERLDVPQPQKPKRKRKHP